MSAEVMETFQRTIYLFKVGRIEEFLRTRMDYWTRKPTPSVSFLRPKNVPNFRIPP